MRVHFSEEENQYLHSVFLVDKPYLKYLFENSMVELDENLADDIRDWAGERQQIKGFDKDFNLNMEGKLLDIIIDKLNH